MELIKRLIVHQDKGDIVRHRAGAEAKDIIVTGIDPGTAQWHLPEQQTGQNHEGSATGGLEKILFEIFSVQISARFVPV
jgi:hypothetical protein